MGSEVVSRVKAAGEQISKLLVQRRDKLNADVFDAARLLKARADSIFERAQRGSLKAPDPDLGRICDELQFKLMRAGSGVEDQKRSAELVQAMQEECLSIRAIAEHPPAAKPAAPVKPDDELTPEQIAAQQAGGDPPPAPPKPAAPKPGKGGAKK